MHDIVAAQGFAAL